MASGLLTTKRDVPVPSVTVIGLVPATAAGAATAASQPSANGGSGLTFDPSGALLTRAREADAQITYLQARIRELEAEMKGAP